MKSIDYNKIKSGNKSEALIPHSFQVSTKVLPCHVTRVRKFQSLQLLWVHNLEEH